MNAVTFPRRRIAAKVGDLVITHQRLNTGYWACDAYSIGAVTKTTWRGRPTQYKVAGDSVDMPVREEMTVHVIPQNAVDVAGVLAEAALHTFPGVDVPKPYPTRSEVDAVVRPHLVDPLNANTITSGWELAS